jgi:hypothetical protein
MIPPDQEIYEVEARIAARRAQVAGRAQQAGQRARHVLTSPGVLIAAAALGFLVAGGLSRREKAPPHPERRKTDHVKKTGIAGAITTGAMWLIRAKYGSPTRFVQAMLQKLRPEQGAPSSIGDIRKTRIRRAA